MKRRDLLKFSAASAAVAIASSASPRIAVAQTGDTIRIGGLLDLSGPFSAYGTNKMRCLELAVDEINATGGLLGRKLALLQYDTQSNNQLYGQYAQQLALRDRVAVVHGAVTSAAREVARPVLTRARTLYFYNMIYEGGLCDKNTFVTGPTPQQLLAMLIPYMVKRFGKRAYVLAADYNFGHFSAAWASKIAAEAGGEVIATEFFPLDVNTFGPTISKIQQAKPDFVFNIFVGPAHAAFYGQWAAAGMNKQIPMASHTLGDGGEHRRMPTEVSEGLITVKNYFDELDTPANADFLRRFAAKFGRDYGYLGSLSIADYQGMYLWAEAVKKAGTVDRNKVIGALETGIAIQGPSGPVRIQPASHHCYLNMYLAEVKGGKFEIRQTMKGADPTSGDDRCNLVKNPNTNTQFKPQI